MNLTTETLFQVAYSLFFIYLARIVLKWLQRYVAMIIAIKPIPAPYTMLPFIGNGHKLKPGSEFLQQLKQIANSYKDGYVFKMWAGTHPIIVFHKAESVEYLMNSSKHIDKSPEYRFFHPWLGTGLLTSTGDKWITRRRLLTPSFHFDILNDFLMVMNEQADIFVEKLRNKAKSNESFDITPFISNCTLDIICETAMGTNVNAQKENNSPYVTAVVRLNDLIFLRMKYLWYANDFIFYNSSAGKEHEKLLKIIKDFTRKVIMERAQDFDDANLVESKRVAFLDTLLKSKQVDQSLTFDDIQEEVDTFMFEGHDTTAAAAAWTCHLIGDHPEVQKKIHEELDRVFGNSERHATQDDLRELKYLEAVIKETLRLFPSVAFFGRTITEDAVCGEYKIPKGVTGIIFAYQVHRDEKFFKDAESFNPERFLDESLLNKHPYAYIPFSAGKRNCIGQKFALMEEKVLLSSLLRKFTIKAIQKRDEIEEDFEVILRSRNGIIVELKARD